MGDSARLVVSAAVGIAVGVYASPAAGFQAFSLTYGATGFLDPNQKVQGPRLDDTKAPQASYGAPIPYIEGSPRVAGIYAWASEKREVATTEEVGGKGGPSTDSTTYTYEIDVLYLLSINQIAGIRRIWSYGELIWSAASDADDATLKASLTTEAWRAIRIYTGASDQLPDPTYEAAVGVGNAPAYRGRGSVFIEGLQLQGGGQVPLLTFEVVTAEGGVYRSSELWSGSIAGELPDDDSLVGSINLTDPNTSFQRHRRLETETLTVFDFEIQDDEAQQSTSSFLSVDGAWQVPGLNQGFCDDQSVLLAQLTPNSLSALYDLDGTVNYTFTRAQSDGSTPIYYCARGSRFVAMSTNDAGEKRITRFARAGGAQLAESAAISLDSTSLIFDDEYVYTMRTDSGTIVDIYDLTSLTFVETIDTPSDSSTNALTIDDEGVIYYFDGSVFSLNADRTWALVSNDLSADAAWGNSADFVHPPIVKDGVFYKLSRTPFSDSGGTVLTAHAARRLLSGDAVPLDEVVSRLCLRTGLLSASDIDVTELAGSSVRAMAVSQVTPTRTVLENLMRAYLFECVEGEKLKFVLRGGAPALTIPFEDLGASSGGDAPEPLQVIRRNDIEIPAFVTVKYANMLNDFQDGSESSDRLTTDSSSIALVEIPLGLTPQEAKRIADVTAMDLAVSVLGLGALAIDTRYAALEPTDVVLLTGETGSTYRARFVKTNDAQGLRQVEAVIDDATIINSEALTDESYTGSTIVRALAATELALLDLPILRDADNEPGFYAAAGANGRWPGSTLRRSRDGIDYSDEVASFNDRAILGLATTALADWAGGYKFDETSSVTVDVGDGELTSSTREAMQLDSTVNVLSIGVQGSEEIIQFRTAILQSEGVYKLTGLLRGRRGTEAFMSGHAIGDTVVLLRPTGMRRIAHPSTDIGLSRSYKAVTFGKSLESATAESFADTGRALQPFSPTNARAERDASTGDITLTWDRRTRLAVRYGGVGGSYTPLGESSESYSIDIYADNTFAAVIRTLTATSETVQYTSADQVTDFGSNQAEVYVGIHQLSAIVGRGTELQAAA